MHFCTPSSELRYDKLFLKRKCAYSKSFEAGINEGPIFKVRLIVACLFIACFQGLCSVAFVPLVIVDLCRLLKDRRLAPNFMKY